MLPLSWSELIRRRLAELKYADLPMDLADAALVRVAEREGIGRFFTTDREGFAIYRLHGKIRPVVVP